MSTTSVIESATKWMEDTARDDTHGYSQVYRWGPDYDCSSAVITAWQQAGIPVKTGGASYTGNIYGVFKKHGFKDVTSTVNLKTGAGLQRGDVLLNKAHHVAMYCGNKKEVEASINELGRAIGGKTGDQTGREFLIRNYRNYPWDCVLRYEGAGVPLAERATTKVSTEVKTNHVEDKLYQDKTKANGEKYKVIVSSLMLRSDASTNSKIVKSMPKGSLLIWYGYYKYNNGNKWLYVQSGSKAGYACTGEGGKKYMEVF